MRIRVGLTYAALLALAAFLVAPFVWMMLVSLHPSRAPIPEMGALVPAQPAWGNYRTVLLESNVPVDRFFWNSVIVSVAAVAGQILVCGMAGYGFARYRFWGREWLFGAFLASLMFAGTVTQIPVFLMLRSWGWLDTYAALIVPSLSSAFNVFLLRQFFRQIPAELEDAARMDGAGDWRLFWQVMLPMARPAVTTCAAFTFIAVWTDFLWPLIATQSQRMRTLEVGLSVFQSGYGPTNWPLQMTASVVTLVPLLIVFLMLQKGFIRGVTLGGLKE